MAAVPTDFMVMAENQYGSMAPIRRKAKVRGCRISTLEPSQYSTYSTYIHTYIHAMCNAI
jgi:hypothetical protein